jgi:hypothetical protein
MHFFVRQLRASAATFCAKYSKYYKLASLIMYIIIYYANLSLNSNIKLCTHFKLGTVSTMNADISTSYCKPHSINNTSKEVVWPRSNEDVSIVSDVTKSVYEDNSVMAARAALEQARSQLDILGLLSSSSCRDLSVVVAVWLPSGRLMLQRHPWSIVPEKALTSLMW